MGCRLLVFPIRKLLHTKLAVLAMLVVRLVPIRLFVALLLKGGFIAMQILAIWLVTSWIGGHPLPLARGVVTQEATSYSYLIIGAAALIVAAMLAFLSKILILRSVRCIEAHIYGRLPQKSGLESSDFRNLSKLLVSTMDAFMPAVFIISIAAIWVFIAPLVLIPVVGVGILVMILFRKAVGFSARAFQNNSRRIAVLDDYIGSLEHKKFYRTLMVPQYITLVSYVLIALGIVAILISVRELKSSTTDLGLLPIASALALLQFRSFVVFLVRYGAYYRSVEKVVSVLNNG